MKLRMYLRGLGIGIAISAIVFSFGGFSNGKTMTDAQIIAKAKELGMVEEGSTLIDAKVEEPKVEEPKVEEPKKEESKKEEPKVEEPKKEEPKKEEPKVEEPKKEEPKKEEPKVEEPKVEEPKVEEPKKEEPKKEEPKVEEPKKDDSKNNSNGVKTTSSTTITIAGGSSSDTVARLLEKGGVIDSATKFDDYLCKNKYDHKITTGAHVIPAGADYETIAKIITSN